MTPHIVDHSPAGRRRRLIEGLIAAAAGLAIGVVIVAVVEWLT